MINSSGRSNRMGRGFALGSLTGLLLASCLALLPSSALAQGDKPGPDQKVNPQGQAAVQQFMAGPSVFIQNEGQWTDASIQFALDGSGANVGLTDKGPRFQLFRRTAAPSDPSDPQQALKKDTPPPSEMHEFAVVFDGAVQVAPKGQGKSERTFNYLMGDVANHREGVPSFDSVWYEGLYPGIALELTGRRTGIKYNFHLDPGADWRAIRVKYDGVEGLSLRPDGALEIRIVKSWEPLADGAPYIYQMVNGEKVTIPGKFTLIDDHTYGFEVTGAYDATLPLVIDPGIIWSTYLGGSGDDRGYGIAVDSDRNVYATGLTNSSGWVSVGWDTTLNDGGPGYDAYVVKLDPKGVHPWSTYLGGSGADYGYGIAVDSSGNSYATGYTASAGWVSNGWNTTYGGNDGYVVKLGPTGLHVWSTYLGGTGYDKGLGIAVDSSNGYVYATGETRSGAWVTLGGDTTLDGTSDAYVVKLSTAGVYQWSTYLGGTGTETGNGIAVDSSGNAYVTGTTNSTSWITLGGDTTLNDDNSTLYSDGYVVKLGTAGTQLWGTYLGGAYDDVGNGIVVDSTGNAYVTGTTTSAGWVSLGWNTTYGGDPSDGYVVKLSTAGAHLWSTYLGGTGTDLGGGIALDSSANVYVTGSTDSAGWVSGGWDTSQNGGLDAFAVKLNTAGVHVWSSYVGGTLNENGNGIAVDSRGDAYVTGNTTSTGWVSGGWDTSYNGGAYDGYVAKIGEILQITQNPVGAQRYVGDSFNITVQTAHGEEPLSYHWTKNGTDIPLETGTAFSLPTVSLLDAGTYACRVTDFYRTVTSTGAVLQVAEHTGITTDPVGGSVYTGNSFTFTVAASGGLTPLSYHWRHDGSPIGSATGTSLVLNPLVLGDAGNYDCVVTDNGSDNVPSGLATLVVAGHLQITTQPQGVGRLVGASYTFSVVASGGYPSLTYHWTKNGSDIDGKTGTALALGPVSLLDAGTYACRVTDALIPPATVTSTNAVLQVANPIAIVTHPVSQTITAGQPVTFTVTKSGGLGPISYQWRKGGMNLDGADQSAYTIPSVLVGNAGSYTCAVTDEYIPTTVVSDAAILTVIGGMPVTGGLTLAAALLAAGLGALRRRRRTH